MKALTRLSETKKASDFVTIMHKFNDNDSSDDEDEEDEDDEQPTKSDDDFLDDDMEDAHEKM